MAQITTAINEARKAGVRRMKKPSPKTDMTPMVDLGFLLITFFVFTSSLGEPHALQLNMPADGPPMPIAKSTALTILLGKDNTVYYYEEDPVTMGWQQAIASGKVVKSNFSVRHGIGEVIRNKQKQLDKQPMNGEGKEGLMMLIKAGEQSAYKNIIDVLDEAMINGVKKYAVVKISAEESKLLQDK
ncbi:MAG TPA: biopolymer transporter ExbD [Chitinophagaceae bacterium]